MVLCICIPFVPSPPLKEEEEEGGGEDGANDKMACVMRDWMDGNVIITCIGAVWTSTRRHSLMIDSGLEQCHQLGT